MTDIMARKKPFLVLCSKVSTDASCLSQFDIFTMLCLTVYKMCYWSGIYGLFLKRISPTEI